MCFPPLIEGTLTNDHGDGKKEIVLDWQNKNFVRVSRFFVHFFADYDVKVLNSRFVEDGSTRQQLSFCFPKL